ncbi:MAG TPA: type II toxin-antitoxin system VapC family toxin [Rhizomicrobium sp.]|nr:type II toxin-antitoxin system VapC family toxin [Rhizomicrobium sp.]
MIVIDTSAIVAVLLKEPPAEALAERLAGDRVRGMSTASYLETGTVLAGRTPAAAQKTIDALERFLIDMSIDLVPVDAEQARLALRARIEYGRGFGAAAKLNFGDCFSYALAKTLSAPLLYVGGDFDGTDVARA